MACVKQNSCSFAINSLHGMKRHPFEQKRGLDFFRILYTHHHSDHISGVEAYLNENGDNENNNNKNIKIIAHKTTEGEMNNIVSLVGMITSSRAQKQFGELLRSENSDQPIEYSHINSGIGPFLNFGAEQTSSHVTPTNTFSDQTKITVAGNIELQLEHAPGETDDQILIWWPEQKAIFPGDNIYKSFPNIYTIRGAHARDANAWVNSLDKIREKIDNKQYGGLEYLCGSHTRPVIGKERIREIVTKYRDGIQFVHDQTLHLLNQGIFPDQIVKQVKLPPVLENGFSKLTKNICFEFVKCSYQIICVFFLSPTF